jgi:hypothetical protein
MRCGGAKGSLRANAGAEYVEYAWPVWCAVECAVCYVLCGVAGRGAELFAGRNFLVESFGSAAKKSASGKLSKDRVVESLGLGQ